MVRPSDAARDGLVALLISRVVAGKAFTRTSPGSFDPVSAVIGLVSLAIAAVSFDVAMRGPAAPGNRFGTGDGAAVSLADSRIFPAVEVRASSTRGAEGFMAPEESRLTMQRMTLTDAEVLAEKLKETQSNDEFLLRFGRTAP